jgi:molecular chaperone GrpE (heat shock protein)
MKAQNNKNQPEEEEKKQEQQPQKTQPVADQLIEEWKQKYLRALADYQNLEKRSIARIDEERKFAAEVTLKKFLPAIDSLTRASSHSKDEGLRLAVKELSVALESCGVKRMDVIGKVFDPYTMECIDVIDGEDEKVLEEVAPGYIFLDKVLRVAHVKVGKNSKS